MYNHEIPTPIMSKIQGIIEYKRAKGKFTNEQDTFRADYNILSEEGTRTLDSKVEYNPRHRPRAIDPIYVQEMQKVVEKEG